MGTHTPEKTQAQHFAGALDFVGAAARTALHVLTMPNEQVDAMYGRKFTAQDAIDELRKAVEHWQTTRDAPLVSEPTGVDVASFFLEKRRKHAEEAERYAEDGDRENASTLQDIADSYMNTAIEIENAIKDIRRQKPS